MDKIFKIANEIWDKSIKDIPQAYISKRIQGLTGETYAPIKELFEKWDFKTPSVCAIISNQNGIGKSHLAASLLRLFVKNYVKENIDKLELEETELPEFNLGFIPERIYLRKFRDGYKDKYFSEKDFYKSYCNFNCLILDDIFSSKETDNEFSRRIILDLINDRFEYYNRPTIITSNLNLQEIADIDTRIASRITNSMLIEITTKQTDYRRIEDKIKTLHNKEYPISKAL